MLHWQCSESRDAACRQGLKGGKGEKGSSVFLSENDVSAGLIEGPPGPRGPIGLPGEKVSSDVHCFSRPT